MLAVFPGEKENGLHAPHPAHEPITVPACKAMNGVAQAIARTKDTWWQQS